MWLRLVHESGRIRGRIADGDGETVVEQPGDGWSSEHGGMDRKPGASRKRPIRIQNLSRGPFAAYLNVVRAQRACARDRCDSITWSKKVGCLFFNGRRYRPIALISASMTGIDSGSRVCTGSVPIRPAFRTRPLDDGGRFTHGSPEFPS